MKVGQRIRTQHIQWFGCSRLCSLSIPFLRFWIADFSILIIWIKSEAG
ncbi:hypothetical protein KSS87_007449 [Heliosperma pusillum]|nr:hypothetical protein KSS87_007449 [Heliosperma pusillum]